MGRSKERHQPPVMKMLVSWWPAFDAVTPTKSREESTNQFSLLFFLLPFLFFSFLLLPFFLLLIFHLISH
jgi:hypothetical protein